MKILVAVLAATTTLAAAALADEKPIKEFRIALLGGENAQDRVDGNECLAAHLSEALGVPTRLFTPADYDGAILGLLGGTIDLAWLGASSYAKVFLTRPEAVEPVLVKTDAEGRFTHFAIGFARRDSGISSLADMRGRIMGFADPNSTTGYLIPSVEIPEQIGATLDPGDFFGDVRFTGGHEQTVVAVSKGDIDAGVAWADGIGDWETGYNSGALRLAAEAGLVEMSDLIEIWRSRPIPAGPIVLRTALSPEVKETVIAVYTGLHETDPDCASGVANGETAGFRPIAHEAYTSIIAAHDVPQD